MKAKLLAALAIGALKEFNEKHCVFQFNFTRNGPCRSTGYLIYKVIKLFIDWWHCMIFPFGKSSCNAYLYL